MDRVSMFERVVEQQQNNEFFWNIIQNIVFPLGGGFFGNLMGEEKTKLGVISGTIIDVFINIETGGTYTFNEFCWTMIGFTISWFLFAR